MERQGSGFRKITEAYYAAHNYRSELEPKFYSDVASFQVTLYNLNYGIAEKVTIETEKVAFEQEKVAFEERKAAFERSLSEIKANTPTKEKALSLFECFEYERAFSRADIIQMFNMAQSSAGKMINKLKETDLIEAVTGQGKGKYKFIQK